MEPKRPRVAVIMAGGPGERLWPLSRPGRPKPLVEVEGETLISRAYRRALRIAQDPGRVYLIALEGDRERMLEELPDLPPSQFLGEPSRRDTAMAVLCAAEVVAERFEDPVLAVLPADHVMRNEDAFAQSMTQAMDHAADHYGICLLGAVPTGPRQEFGYIVPRSQHEAPRTVERFVEKPEGDLAGKLVAQGALWNMGVFIGQARALLAAARDAVPELAESARTAAGALLVGDRPGLVAAYEPAQKLPFDRAVLECATGLRVVPCDAGWSDLGNWPEFVRYHRESQGDLDAPLEWREPGAPPLQVLGTVGLIVASTPAGSLVASLDAAAQVRPPKHDGSPFVPKGARVVEKPWGAEYVWAETERYAGKLLFVRAGHSLSLQYHELKLESMWVLQGAGILELGGVPTAIGPGSTVTITPGTVHRLEAHHDLSVLEVSTPELDDVVRLKDAYGRA